MKFSHYLLVEIFTSLVLILLLVASSTHFSLTYFIKAKVSDAFVNFSVLRLDISSSYIETGHWPQKQVIEDRTDTMDAISKISFDGNGTINIIFSSRYPQLSNKILSFTAARVLNLASGNIIWNCGYSSLPQYYSSLGNNRTSINRKYLPNICKS